MKRILTIQDISCLGKCSTTVALPILSALGIETVILPTALLSAHTIFKGFTFKDLTGQLIPITEHWRREGIRFDAIYTGFLGSAEEIGIVSGIFGEFRTPETLIFVDPVMADRGKLYPAFDESYAALNAQLCSKADIIVPNITEACFMTGTSYRETYDEAYILRLLDNLSRLGARKSFLTGVSLSPGRTGVYGIDGETGEYTLYQHDLVGASYHGTGDIFSSTAVGCLVRGPPLREAFKIAADYTAETIRVTLEDPERPWYGVDFEATLPTLIRALEDGRRGRG